MATVRWLEEQQAVGIRPPPPHMYITLFFSSFFFTTLFRRLIINPLTSLFFLARSFYPVGGRKLERCKFYFNLKTNLIKIWKNLKKKKISTGFNVPPHTCPIPLLFQEI